MSGCQSRLRFALAIRAGSQDSRRPESLPAEVLASLSCAANESSSRRRVSSMVAGAAAPNAWPSQSYYLLAVLDRRRTVSRGSAGFERVPVCRGAGSVQDECGARARRRDNRSHDCQPGRLRSGTRLTQAATASGSSLRLRDHHCRPGAAPIDVVILPRGVARSTHGDSRHRESSTDIALAQVVAR